MNRYRILSMDGTSASGGSGFVTAGDLIALRRMLDEAGDERPLLDQVDLFVGTSAGSFNAAFLANFAKPDEGLAHIIDYWGEVVARNKDGFSLLRTLAVPTGQSAMLSSKPMRDFFVSYFGTNLRLGDLKHGVVIPSFQLDNNNPKHRRWKPKIFHNTGSPNDTDLDELVVDVLMRSGSPPLLYPIAQALDEKGPGFVDGGTYANNPAAVGLAQAVRNLVHGNGVPVHLQEDPIDLDEAHGLGVLLLSMGNARVNSYLDPCFRDGVANWGFGEWLLDLRQPLVLITMMLEAGVEAIDYIVRCMLQKQYMRVDPVLDSSVNATDRKGVVEAIHQILALPDTKAMLAAAVAWMEKSGWLESDAELDAKNAESVNVEIIDPPPESGS